MFNRTLVLAVCLGVPALADPPVIEAVRVEGGQVHVTVRHPDTGWDHYADVWRVYAPDGTELAERILLHPHENEQPFTRSTKLPEITGLAEISVVAACTDGDVSQAFPVSLGGG